MNYTHPNKSNECFLAMHYLSYHMFTLITGDILYELLLRVLTEQNIIFITDNINYLTSLVLGFYYLIQPFKWPFIIIPNLPLDLIEVIESPVPFLIGLLIEPQKIHLYLSKKFIEENNCNIITYVNDQLKFINKVQVNFTLPDLGHMKQIISQNMSQIHFYASSKLNDYYVQACEQLYKNIYGIIKENIAEEIEKCLRIDNIFGLSNSLEFTSETIRKYRSDSFDVECFNSYDKFNNTNYEDEYKKYLQNVFIKNQKKENKSFAKVFVETQIFASYVDDIIDRFKRNEE